MARIYWIFAGAILGGLLGVIAVGGLSQGDSPQPGVLSAWRRLLLTAGNTLLERHPWALSLVALATLMGCGLAIVAGRGDAAEKNPLKDRG